MKFYHNPRCQKSRQALEVLKGEGLAEEIEVIEYLKTPVNKTELQNILKLLNINPEDLIRKKEPDFKTHFKGQSDVDWIQAMIDFPKLIERPILVANNKAVIGRPPEKVLSIL